jgi:site-specific DNA-methyltransferase (adenine-specific)
MELFDEVQLTAKQRGQYSTAPWVIAPILRGYFPELGPTSFVVDPGCGEGAWLNALPADTPAIGIEVDASLAGFARESTGRRIITGDFRYVDLDGIDATHVIGNPPFGNAIIRQFLNRAYGLLREGGKIGFVMPAHTLAAPRYVLGLHRRFSIEQTMIPRYIYPRLSLPLIFAVFTKERTRKLVGFALYQEFASIAEMPADYQGMLKDPRRRAPWRDVVADALKRLGGRASLEQLYTAIEPRRPSATRTWQDTVRRVCGESFVRVSHGVFALPAAA